ncbi:MAG: di-trans,poly-cis-decaprenylcistransferase [Candidatus Diapherotrites archaeon]|uniref:Di-trans,poly-cis-decaprenylcistransferase n=1 Tax=Candidatus Iainarchaeum sp. TaxID=3101447 RepID=A0A2D6LP03_9ARCH|nr:di-trans,poly-cis-decaprenylcistransferase [Candidatus Diapherotrites archaeon]|tara:strand:+ start:8639 stop:9346 length:708 start_codon:yes stop_codon:yes gene_type:complete
MYNSGYHIGVIPDGNRRWANKNELHPSEGHKKGAKSMELFVNWAIKNPAINEISIYGLSEENFKRNPKELSNLYDIYYKGLSDLVGSKTIHENKVNVNLISTSTGNVPGNILDVCTELKSETKYYGNKMLNILIGYTGQSEILKSVSSPMNRVKNLLFGLSEKDVSKHLGVKNECDLVIRTGEEEARREAKSGFLLWQSTYSEYYHIPKYWPEVQEKDFDNAWEYFVESRRLKGK